MSPSRSAALAVLAALLGGLVSLLGWAVSSPTGSSPDDDYHLASIWCARGIDDDRCAEAPNEPTVRLLPPLASGAGICYANDFAKSASCQIGLDTPEPTVRTDHGNWGGAYPPVFYRTLAVFVGDDVSRSVLVMRVFLCVVTVSMVGLLALLLPTSRKPFAWLPLLITSVPLGMFLLSSVNPSNWAILGVAVLWPALYFAFETTGRRQWSLAAFAILAAVMAAGSRADTGLFVILVAVLVAMMRARRLHRQPVAAAAVAVVLVIAALYFLQAGHSSEVVDVASPGQDHGVTPTALLLINFASLPTLWLGGFGAGPMGRAGWLDTPFPPLVALLAIAVWFTFLLQGWRRSFPAKTMALALVAAALIVHPLYLLYQTNNLVGAFVQPRYVMPILTLFTALSLLGHRRIATSLSKRAWLTTTASLSLAHALGLHIQIRRYVTGLDVSAINLDRDRQWWWSIPASPMVVWVVASVGFAVMAGVLLRTLRRSGETGTLPRDSTRPSDGAYHPVLD